MNIKKKPYKRIALVLSSCAIIAWLLLGTGTSLAWFTDTSVELKNIFHKADFDLVVSHRLEDGSYEEIDIQTKVFSDEALYEPGYVQVVYLKVENRGDLPFDFRTAVSVTDYTPGINIYGSSFNLQDYLLFGLVMGETEAELEQQIATRELAEAKATLPLCNYSTDVAALAAGDEMYMALIVQMPKPVSNVANYMPGTAIPRVELGLIVSADQQRTTP